ncbi:MAG TPA: gluconokinase [Acetobacteraceae bacterium]|jgi:carbohydrate kinase (thermoresistant glucokinase family)|nr:gluconokinase [Acetobacteraceae bacterium]
MTVALMMGVSGSGKTTIAQRVAEREGWRLVEGDDFHPPENVAKMKSGTPLTDEDRWPWLRAIAAEIDAIRARGESAVVTSSALKRAYRAILVGDRIDVVLVYLQGSKELIARRMAARKGHFMPPALLDSQFATLEEPGDDEHPVVVSIEPTPDEIVDDVVRKLKERTG